MRQPELAAASNIHWGTKLNKEHSLLVETDISILQRQPLTDISEVVGRELKYGLTADRALHQDMVWLPKVVKRDELR